MSELVHLAEFEQILADYKISTASQAILDKTKLILLVAATSAGRNTIIKELLKTGEYHYIVSDTTRAPRVNDGVLEQNGVQYWFRTEDQVLKDLKAGKFLEAAIIHSQQVSGISVRELAAAAEEGKAAVTDIEVIGTENIKRAKADTIALFILPPSLEVWLARLARRGQLHPGETRRRLESAAKELKMASERPYYSFIINDYVNDAVRRIRQIVETGQPDIEHHQKGQQLAKKLYEQTLQLLKEQTD